MNSKEWLHKVEHPGSTTCFLLGRLSSEEHLHQLSPYQDVVWFVNKDYVQPRHQLHGNIHISTLESLDQEKLNEVIKLLIQVNPLALPDIYCCTSIIELHSPAYDFILQRIQIISEEIFRARLTRQEEGYIAQKNILENLPYYVTNRATTELKDSQKEIPVAVIGAGPSLDATIHIVKEYGSKFLVFAVDSALGILHEQGITPDATFSIDAEKPAAACVQEQQCPGSLFLSIKSPNDWCQFSESSKHFLSGNNLTEDWLVEQGIPKSELSALGNCGITAVKTAMHLGCSPILLFGMDHATSEFGEGHAQNVNQAISRGKSHNPASRNTTVPGNYSPRVKTFLLNEWEKLDQLISNLPESQEVWNINDRGAKYEKAKLVHPDQFTFNGKTLRHRPQISSNNPEPEQNDYLLLVDALDQLVSQQKATIDRILNSDDFETTGTLQNLSQIFQHPHLSKLLGNLSFKTIPNLLKWNTLMPEEKKSILDETKALLTLLKNTKSYLGKNQYESKPSSN